MINTQRTVLLVLDRIARQVRENQDDAEMYADFLDDVLDNMHSNDCFGTEGQCDPRGDRRNGVWTIWDPEGYEPVKHLPFQSESGDWFGIPESQFEAETKAYREATDENTMLLFEEGHTGWVYCESVADVARL